MDIETNNRLQRLENMIAALLQRAGADATIEQIKEYFTPHKKPLKDLKWKDTTKLDELLEQGCPHETSTDYGDGEVCDDCDKNLTLIESAKGKNCEN